MNLVIRAHTLKNETLSQSITGRFDERGGTIGRSDSNTLVLPDPERHISRLQAEIWFSNGAFSIRNVGSANTITINGRPINPGEGATLAHADELLIGSYTMRATLVASPVAEPAFDSQVPVDSRTVIQASAVESKTNPRMRAPPAREGAAAQPSTNPFSDLLSSPTPSSSTDPFGNLMGAAPAKAERPAPPRVSVPAEPTPARLPDDFDPFADLPPSPSPSRSADAALASFMSDDASARPQSPNALPTDLGLGDLLGNSRSSSDSSLDDVFGLNTPRGPAAKDPLDAFLATPTTQGMPSSKDPLAMFGARSDAKSQQAIPADFNHTPELHGAYSPPAVQPSKPGSLGGTPSGSGAKPLGSGDANATQRAAPRTDAGKPAASIPTQARTSHSPPRPHQLADSFATATIPAIRHALPAMSRPPLTPPPAKAAPQPSASTPPPAPARAAPVSSFAAHDTSPQALWAAFCEGAGISLMPPQGLNAELMRVLGQVLRHSVDGTLKLVAVRTTAKQELRADVTTIQSRNNNPLKFSPDAGVAIEQLLQPPMRGFMTGPVAMREAMDDLLGHAIGTMTGMRAALAGVLKRFEPAQLEGMLSGNSMLDAVLPMNRRAKLWELYLQHYERIHNDAQDDFHELFGKAFIEAYEEQLDRLDASRHPE